LQRAREIAKIAKKWGIKNLSLWGFSTENWQRAKHEVKYLMFFFEKFLQDYLEELKKDGVRLRWLGRRDRIPQSLKSAIEKAEKETAGNYEYNLNLCLDYGGRDEILRAAKNLIKDRKKMAVSENKEITEKEFSNYLDTAGLPDPDLLIRTSGEMRTSGILPWQTIYTELYFARVSFPDFTTHHLKRAINQFRKRQRRFGF
jgi:undecaprenyl diphosphate synthase